MSYYEVMRSGSNVRHNTGMDKTSLDTSSRTLFVREGGCPRNL